ncbi:MAG TPA: VWA domain-containing protein [Bryobacteraceae bacterium]|jgi:VWFA-related protein|nr:VWA domain-containing protein [Bryobacteraceae bacterium]
MHYFGRPFAAASTLLLLSTATPGQDEATFSTDVKVVNILATVRTKSGQIVNDLTKDDFSVTENGHPEVIKYFSRESDLPLTIGLMVDTSMSQARVLESERSASFQFVDQVLREGKDKVFVTQFDMAVLTRQGLTSSRRDLEQSLPYVDTPSKNELQAQRGGGTLLFDAVVKASREIMSGQQNRKAMIILSDGGDNGSDETLNSAIEAAQRADTLIYSILFADPAYGYEGEGKTAMQRLAKETGGSFFEVSKKHHIDEIYGIIEQELRSQYNLGFVSDQPVRVSEFRKLQLITDRKDLVVDARDRYWAQR